MPIVAEIVGPAGSGKSTLACELRRRDRRVRAGLGVWGLPRPLLVSTALMSLPRLIGAWRLRRAVGWKEAGLIVRASALSRLIGSAQTGREELLLLDEGTVFALAKLDAFGAGVVGGDGGRMERLVGRWADRLDAVVWLDAPDEVLARRIRGRGKPHRMKSCSDEEISAFLARYRESYERVVAGLCRRRGRLKVIRVRTDEGTPEQLADRVMSGIAGAEG